MLGDRMADKDSRAIGGVEDEVEVWCDGTAHGFLGQLRIVEELESFAEPVLVVIKDALLRTLRAPVEHAHQQMLALECSTRK